MRRKVFVWVSRPLTYDFTFQLGSALSNIFSQLGWVSMTTTKRMLLNGPMDLHLLSLIGETEVGNEF